ncbi:DUF1127 domain-containing protein [Thioclava sp. NG1]|uniref:DUF1127 domain-containing protein n=1 Tax=unclassified Thioclava TaxID=2621713 RepID=UPI000B546392|nr:MULTISPECIES: DUF1127 domain-containing protein [unclassified Thioclava]OWY10311.1 primosomal protein DnaI [Thioclava sp. F34-6]PWE48345.1 DUF1127 domain-containing protein [Thioclava sp. NG1]
MSTMELNRSVAGRGVAAVFANIFSALLAWNEARVTRQELHGLSDRELKDIGLLRGDIDRVARGL